MNASNPLNDKKINLVQMYEEMEKIEQFVFANQKAKLEDYHQAIKNFALACVLESRSAFVQIPDADIENIFTKEGKPANQVFAGTTSFSKNIHKLVDASLWKATTPGMTNVIFERWIWIAMICLSEKDLGTSRTILAFLDGLTFRDTPLTKNTKDLYDNLCAMTGLTTFRKFYNMMTTRFPESVPFTGEIQSVIEAFNGNLAVADDDQKQIENPAQNTFIKNILSMKKANTLALKIEPVNNNEGFSAFLKKYFDFPAFFRKSLNTESIFTPLKEKRKLAAVLKENLYIEIENLSGKIKEDEKKLKECDEQLIVCEKQLKELPDNVDLGLELCFDLQTIKEIIKITNQTIKSSNNIKSQTIDGLKERLQRQNHLQLFVDLIEKITRGVVLAAEDKITTDLTNFLNNKEIIEFLDGVFKLGTFMNKNMLKNESELKKIERLFPKPFNKELFSNQMKVVDSNPFAKELFNILVIKDEFDNNDVSASAYKKNVLRKTQSVLPPTDKSSFTFLKKVPSLPSLGKPVEPPKLVQPPVALHGSIHGSLLQRTTKVKKGLDKLWSVSEPQSPSSHSPIISAKKIEGTEEERRESEEKTRTSLEKRGKA